MSNIKFQKFHLVFFVISLIFLSIESASAQTDNPISNIFGEFIGAITETPTHIETEKREGAGPAPKSEDAKPPRKESKTDAGPPADGKVGHASKNSILSDFTEDAHQLFKGIGGLLDVDDAQNKISPNIKEEEDLKENELEIINELTKIKILNTGPWNPIVASWKQGLSKLSKEAVNLGEAQADVAEALGLKQEAALMRLQSKMLKKAGDSLGGSDLEEFGKNSASVQNIINKKLDQALFLSGVQKRKLTEAGSKLSLSITEIGKAGFLLFSTSLKAANAESPSVLDIGALPVAIKLPLMISAAISVIPKLFDITREFQGLAEEKDVAVPKIPKAPSFS